MLRICEMLYMGKLSDYYLEVLLVLCGDPFHSQFVHLITNRVCEKATGGGAYKFADLFKERLGVSIEKEDEMDCLVAGANFLLKV